MRPGTVLSDRFVVEALAGAGGMGTVYRGLDTLVGVPVAIKVVSDLHAGEDARFAREGALLASFDHPGIVRHVAQGRTAEGAPYLVMEWLEGGTLADRLRRGRMPSGEALALLSALASALAVVHAHGVVHRDLKPANVFLPSTAPFGPKLLDFGIARRVSGGRTFLTAAGTVLGTPAYLSPEQARGASDVDARSDVWALGCILYEMLAGRPAFDHDSVVATLAAILLDAPPPLSEHGVPVGRDVEAMLRAWLSKEPSARPPDASAVVSALASLAAEPEDLAERAAPIAPALTEREQRVVCIVLVEPLEAVRADGRTLLSTDPAHDALARAQEIVGAHDGGLERLVDGSVLVRLEGPGGALDQAERAVRCGLALREALPDTAVAVAAGRASWSGRFLVGAVVDSGARLLRLPPAPAGAVRLDPRLAGWFEGRADEARVQLGLDAHGSWACPPSGPLAPGLSIGSRATAVSPFVGRERELATLAALYDECTSEPIARVAVVLGAPGVGKSRLLSEFLARAVRTDVPPGVFSARGDAFGAGSPFSLLADALRDAAGIAEGQPLEERRARLRARVSRHLTGPRGARAAAMLGEIARVPFPDDDDPRLAAARRDPRLRGDLARRAFEDFLEAETAVGPVVFALDDAHHGDRPSLTFLDAALRHLAGCPFFVVWIGRPEFEGLFPTVLQGHDPQILRLGRLTPKAARRLIERALGAVDEATVARLVERGEGHPLFLEELARHVRSGGAESLPDSVLGMVEARLASLDAPTRRVLRAVSVFGMRAPVRGTHALLGMHGPVAVLEDRLRTLCDRGWLRPVDAPEPCHEFLGATLREAAYATLPEDEQTLGHRLVADFLVASGDPDPVVLAGHAERGGDPGLAAASWARAAARALTGNDLPAALERSGRGLALARTAETRGALRAVAAAVHRWRGEYGPALDAALEALAGLEASAPERFDALATAISAAGALGRVEDLGRFVDVALEEGPPDTLGPRVVSLCRVAALALGRGDDGQATDLLAQAEALHLRCRDEAPIASAWLDVLRASRALREGDVGAFVARTQSAVDGYERAGDARDACNQRVRLANGWAALGEPGRAEPAVRAALAEAQRIGLPLVEGYAWQNLGHVLFLLGRTGEARAALERAQRAGRALRDAPLEAGALVYLSDLALASGAHAEALAHARQAFERVGAHAMGCVASSSAALACVALGAFDEAARWAAEAQRGTALPGGLEEGEARVRLAQLEVARAAAAGPSSQGLAREAASWLRARASKISDPALREGFLHRVPEHARLLALGEPA